MGVAEVRKSLFLAALALCGAMFISLPVATAHAGGEAREVSSADLLERWREYDGTEVVFTGEVVGDVMRRGDHAWITVNDDHYSRAARLETGELRGGNSGIAVWLPVEEAEEISVLGRYGSKGDLVRVRGTFNTDCREHGGDFDLHARELTVLERGRELESGPSAPEVLASSFAALFLLATLSPYLRRRTREMRAARALLADEKEGEE